VGQSSRSWSICWLRERAKVRSVGPDTQDIAARRLSASRDDPPQHCVGDTSCRATCERDTRHTIRRGAHLHAVPAGRLSPPPIPGGPISHLAVGPRWCVSCGDVGSPRSPSAYRNAAMDLLGCGSDLGSGRASGNTFRSYRRGQVPRDPAFADPDAPVWQARRLTGRVSLTNVRMPERPLTPASILAASQA